MADLLPQIVTTAAQPAEASADGQSTRGVALSDLIAADQYLKASAAVKLRGRGLRFTKLIPPGGADYGPGRVIPARPLYWY